MGVTPSCQIGKNRRTSLPPVTWVGVTGIFSYHWCSGDRFEFACSEGVPSVSRETGAGSKVVLHCADTIDPTCARARIDAFISLTCFVRRTIRINYTFWSTCYIGAPKILVYIDKQLLYFFLTNCVGTTGGWIAWIDNFCWWRICCPERTGSEWVPIVARIQEQGGA